MEKKTYSKPLMAAQRFEPQEFISACPPDESYRIYKFWCNMTGGPYVYIETNGTPGLQVSGNWISNSSQYGLGGPYDQTWASSRSHWGTFSPCGGYHEVKIPCNPDGSLKEDINNYFPAGYINSRQRASGAQPCFVWTDNGTNTHVTRELDYDEYSVHNPS